MNLLMSSVSIDIYPSSSTAVSFAVLAMFCPLSSFEILLSNSFNWYWSMNSPQPKTKMTSSVVFSLRYSAASIRASGWVGSSLVAGLAAMVMAVLSFDAATSSLSLKCRLARFPKVYMGSGWAWGGTAEVDVAWGQVTRAVGISSSSYFSDTPWGVSPLNRWPLPWWRGT